MKKIIIGVVAVIMLVATSCVQAEARDDVDVVFDIVIGVMSGSGVIDTGYNRGYHRGHRGYEYRSSAATRRIQEHREVIRDYNECLMERQIDIQYGVHPRDAKDCSRYHPRNQNWRR